MMHDYLKAAWAGDVEQSQKQTGIDQRESELDTTSTISLLYPGVLLSTKKRASPGWIRAEKILKNNIAGTT